MSAKIQRKQLKRDTRQRRKQKTQRNNPLIYTQKNQNKKRGKIVGKTISRIILGVHTAEKKQRKPIDKTISRDISNSRRKTSVTKNKSNINKITIL